MKNIELEFWVRSGLKQKKEKGSQPIESIACAQWRNVVGVFVIRIIATAYENQARTPPIASYQAIIN